MKTVYRVFDRFDQAERAMTALAMAGMSPDRIGLLSGEPNGSRRKMFAVDVPGIGRVCANDKMRDLLSAAPHREGSMRTALMSLGVPLREVDRCAEALKRGATLEAVVVDDDRVADASAILNRYATESEAADIEDIVVPVVREDLEIGTREVEAGGVRIAARVREVPVEQTVTIREERVTVERRIIDRPIDDIDAAFRDRTIELRATAEEPVVRKRAHVVEEIRIHKDRNERVQKVSDTLRHTDVQLSDLPGERMFDATRYQDHLTRTYGDRYKLETVAPAYEFGEQLSRRIRRSDWSTVETEARASWERHNPGTWDRFKDAIREGWNKLRS